MNLIALMFSSTFFSGFMFGKKGKGGGLIGSILAMLAQLYFINAGFGIKANTFLIILSFFIGILSITRGEKYIFQKWGAVKRHTGHLVISDYNQTNIDEVHGQAISGTSAFLFNITPQGQVALLLISFILFRIFDTKKTWPIKNVEKKFKGSFGIMFDDTVGGIMALMVTIALIYIPMILLF